MMRTLILGLGNPILRDDGVGLRVAEALRPRLAGRTGVTVEVDTWGGLRLMERMVGYDRVVVIDAARSGAPPGTIRRLAPGDMPTQRTASAHDLDLPSALALGRKAGALLPQDDDILILGVEAADVLTFGEELTPEVAAAVPAAADAVMASLGAETT